MTVRWIKATKRNECASEVSTVSSSLQSRCGKIKRTWVCWKSEGKSAGWVFFFSGCLKQVRAPLEGSGTRVSACCSSPPLPSWTGRSGAGWSPSPGRTISHSTLRHRCCPQRKAGGKQRVLNLFSLILTFFLGGDKSPGTIVKWCYAIVGLLTVFVWLLPPSFWRKPCRWAASLIRPDAAARSASTPAGPRPPAGLPAQTKNLLSHLFEHYQGPLYNEPTRVGADIGVRQHYTPSRSTRNTVISSPSGSCSSSLNTWRRRWQERTSWGSGRTRVPPQGAVRPSGASPGSQSRSRCIQQNIRFYLI